MTLQATVLVPTHDHGPMLLHSVGSALAQTVPDLEVFIVGDGVPEITRAVVAELMRQDERVRFFDNPKGPRHGEIHRHAALSEARGEVVCYLSDDDLWLPDHVETMGGLLADADFTHALPLEVETDGTLGGWTVDLSLPYFRELLLSGENRIPLSCGAHTLDMYRCLPFGWRTTPAETPTDLYMWQQFLAQPESRARSGTRPTVLHFPSKKRQDWSLEERLGELERWGGKIADPRWRRRFKGDVLDHLVRHEARVEVKAHAAARAHAEETAGALEATLEARDAEARDLAAKLQAEAARAGDLEATLEARDAEARDLAAKLQAEEARAGALEAQLAAVYTSRSWRITAPLRFVRRASSRMAYKFRGAMSRTARTIYRRAPLPLLVKMRVKKILFRRAAPLFRHTVAYRDWEAWPDSRNGPPRSQT